MEEINPMEAPERPAEGHGLTATDGNLAIRLLIAGSRDMPKGYKKTIWKIIDGIVQQFALRIEEVVSGGARGVDSWGEAWAAANDIPVGRYRPDWKKHGQGAGMIRNTTLVNRCDAGIVFWDGHSRGTLDTVEKLEKKGRPYWFGRLGLVVEMRNVERPKTMEQRAEESGLWVPGVSK
jgi:hypothetical protein